MYEIAKNIFAILGVIWTVVFIMAAILYKIAGPCEIEKQD